MKTVLDQMKRWWMGLMVCGAAAPEVVAVEALPGRVLMSGDALAAEVEGTVRDGKDETITIHGQYDTVSYSNTFTCIPAGSTRTVSADKLETYDWPGEYAQRFDGAK